MSTLYKVADYYAAKINKQADNQSIINVIERYKKASLDQFTSELMKILYKVKPNINSSIKLSEFQCELLKCADNDKNDAIIQYLKYRKSKVVPRLEQEYDDLDEQIAFLLAQYNANKGKKDVSQDSILLNELKQQHGEVGATIESELRWQDEEFSRMLATRIKQLKVEEPISGLNETEFREKVKEWLENYATGSFQVYQPKTKPNTERGYEFFKSKNPSRPVPITDPNAIPKYTPPQPINDYEKECPNCGEVSYETSGPGKEKRCKECGYSSSN